MERKDSTATLVPGIALEYKTCMATTLMNVQQVIDRLAAFSSPSDPVVSFYMDLRSDRHGRRRYQEFFDRAFTEQMDTFEPSSPAYRLLEKDSKRIRRYLQTEILPSASTAAIFSCSGSLELFEAVQLDAALDGHRIYIDRQPHLFPLARLTGEYSAYAALLADTNSARLYIFAIGALQRKLVVQNEKATRTPGVDVFSEGEYQRNAE